MTMGLMPLAWHKVNLENLTKHTSKLYQAFVAAKNEWLRMEAEVDKLERQIARAEEEGKPAFDADLYNVRKR